MMIAEKTVSVFANDRKTLSNSFSLICTWILLVVSGCTQPPDVPFTSPANGAVNVDVATTISVAFTTAMDPVSSTDPANWSIQGSLSGPHPAAGALNEDNRILILTPEVPFQQGETVTVSVTDGVKTSVYIAIDPISIQFTTTGAGAGAGDFETGTGEFTLIQLDPPTGSLDVSRRPSFTATFDLPFEISSANGSVSLRGSRTGIRAVQLAFPSASGGISDVMQVILPGGEAPFYPGEDIELVFDSNLVTQTQSGEETPRKLVPFVARFRSSLGHATGGLGPREPISAVGDQGLILADLGEMLPYTGLEMLTLNDSGQISLLKRGASGEGSSWTVESQLQLDQLPASAVVADIDGDSRSELLVSCLDGTIRVITVLGQVLVEEGEPSDMGGLVFDQLAVAELNGDQQLDLLGTGSDGIRIIQNTITIDPLTFELSSALAVTGILPMPAPVDSLVVDDFDKDGRTDLLVSAGVGVLLRGAGNATFLESAFLDPAPVSIIVAGDVNGDGWLDAITPGASGLSVHINPAGIPPTNWTGIPLLTGGPVLDLAVTEVDGNPAHVDDIVIIQDSSDPLVLIRRLSQELGDSEVVPLPFEGDPSEARLLLVDTDGDNGTDVLVRQEDNSATSLAVYRSLAVVDEQQSALQFMVPSELTLPQGSSTIEIPISATFEDNLSSFTIAMDFDESLLLATDLIADTATFPFGSVDVTVSIDDNLGLIAAEMSINGFIPAGTEVPIARVLMQAQPSILGEAQFLLADGLNIEGTNWSNNGIISDTGAILAAEIASAQGVIIIPSTTDAPEDLTCEIQSAGTVAEVFLNWTNPVNYDLQAGLEIRKSGALLATISGSSTTFTDTDPGQGSLNYSVTGVRAGIASSATACSAVIIPTTTLTCSRSITNLSTVLLDWTSLPGTSGWQLFRDGNLLIELSASQTFYDDFVNLQAHLYEIRAVQGGATSIGATCLVEDEGGIGTDAPVNVLAAIVDTDDVRVTWTNREYYTLIRVFDSGQLIATLGGQETEFLAENRLPGPHNFSIQASGDGGLSTNVQANVVDVPLAPPSQLSCITDGPTVEITWENGPEAYSYDEVVLERTGSAGTEFYNLPGSETSFTDVAGSGEWSYRVIGYYFLDGVNYSAPSASCSVEIIERIYYDPTSIVIGRDFSVDILGQLLEGVSSWSFQIDYDGNILNDLSVTVPGVPASDLIVTDNPLGTFSGLRRVTVEVATGSATAGADTLLATFQGNVDTDFSLLGPVLFHLVGGTLQSTAGTVSSPDLLDGGMEVVGNALFMDSGVLVPGEEVVIWARGVWSQSLTGYSVVLDYDPAVLTCLEVSNVGTVGEDLSGAFGLFFSGIDPLNGKAYGSVLSTFDAIPANPTAELGYFSFLVSPDAQEGTTSLINFGVYDTGGAEIENLFVDSVASSITPILIPADFLVLAEPQAPTLLSVDPSTGPTVGGTQVILNGTGFTPTSSIFFGANSATEIVFIDSGTILATTPESLEGAVDVTVLTEFGQAVLTQGFDYYESSITSYTPGDGSVCSPTTMLVNGIGIPEGLTVLFGDVASSNVQINPDGTMATVRIPASTVTGPVDLRFLDSAGIVISDFPDGFVYFDDGIFLRGDVTCDGLVNIADVAMIAAYVAGSGSAPVLLDSADVDDNGVVHIGDAVVLATWLFDGGPPPALPFPDPGEDPTPDGL